MYLYHVTPQDNVASIMRQGLDPLRSRGMLALCWLCDPDRIAWAARHLWQRKRCRMSEAVIIRVATDEHPISRAATPGLWITGRLISPRALWVMGRAVDLCPSLDARPLRVNVLKRKRYAAKRDGGGS